MTSYKVLMSTITLNNLATDDSDSSNWARADWLPHRCWPRPAAQLPGRGQIAYLKSYCASLRTRSPQSELDDRFSSFLDESGWTPPIYTCLAGHAAPGPVGSTTPQELALEDVNFLVSPGQPPLR